LQVGGGENLLALSFKVTLMEEERRGRRRAAQRERGERVSVVGGESRMRKKERGMSRINYQNAPNSIYFCVPS